MDLGLLESWLDSWNVTAVRGGEQDRLIHEAVARAAVVRLIRYQILDMLGSIV